MDEKVHSVQVSGSDCFLRLATNHFDLHSTLAVVKSKSQYATTLSLGISTEDLILQKLIKTGSWSMMVKFIGAGAKPKVEYGFEKVHNYVIVFQTSDDLSNALQELSLGQSWNPHANFLTYFLGYPTHMDTMMAEVVAVFWKFWAVNVMIVVPSQEIEGHVVRRYWFHTPIYSITQILSLPVNHLLSIPRGRLWQQDTHLCPGGTMFEQLNSTK